MKSELFPVEPSAKAEWKEGSSGWGWGTREQSNPNHAAEAAGTAQTGYRALWPWTLAEMPPWSPPSLGVQFLPGFGQGYSMAWQKNRNKRTDIGWELADSSPGC